MARKEPKFASEVELCRRFLDSLPEGWTPYAETCSWDILLVRQNDGLQIGIQAKLKLGVEVILGGLKPTRTTTSSGDSATTMAANIWEFTVEDPKLVQIVQAKMESGEPATLTYREELVSFCRSAR